MFRKNGLIRVDTRFSESVATLTLDRPDARNALSIELCDAIVEALEVIDRSDVRAIVICGEGKVFCSGADFAAVSGPRALDFLPAFERMLEALARHRLPTVAAIHGAALGGGLQLATVCDFRVAATDATLGIPSSRLGIVVNFENVRRLVQLVGVATAKEVLMLARAYTGAEAARAGLVNSAVDVSDADRALDQTGRSAVVDAAMDVAESFEDLAPLAVEGSKRSIQEVLDHPADEPSDDIRRLVVQAYESEDLQEGLRSMAEKRAPNFHRR